MTLTATKTRTAGRFTTFAAATALVTFMALLTACSSTPSDDVSFEAISKDLTPSLAGTYQRHIDIDGDLAITENLNWRLFSDDLGRVFYTDHPSRLSPIPVVYTSGMPR